MIAINRDGSLTESGTERVRKLLLLILHKTELMEKVHFFALFFYAGKLIVFGLEFLVVLHCVELVGFMLRENKVRHCFIPLVIVKM